MYRNTQENIPLSMNILKLYVQKAKKLKKNYKDKK